MIAIMKEDIKKGHIVVVEHNDIDNKNYVRLATMEDCI